MRRLISVALTLALCGCAALPASGPDSKDVLGEAAADSARRYAVIPVTDQVLSVLRGRSPDGSLASFGSQRAGSVEPRVGAGDALSLTIWEAGSGGLFSSAAAERFVPGSRAAPIPEQMVGRDGMISVPYAGRIRAAGRTTFEIQREIERALEGKAIQPQVIVNVTKPLSNTVTVLGDASGSARMPISSRGDRVLDVIAAAGGVRAPVNESYIQLSRGSRTVRVAMSRVVANPSENIYVRPGDVLTVVRNPQHFIAHGATGRNSEFPLDAEGVNLAQALAQAGGLLDYRANPSGVFLFRYEPTAIARNLPQTEGVERVQDGVRIVYHFDLRDPQQVFIAEKFRVYNRDLIYVSNSALADAQKVLQLFNLVTTPISSGASIATAVR